VAQLALELFGGFQVRAGQGRDIRLPRRKAQALLAYLALRPGQRFSRETLTALLWGDVAEEHARHSLRQALLDVRRALPPGSRSAIVVEGDQIALDSQAVVVDVVAFERLATEASRKAVEQAAALYRGDLLAGFTVREAAFEEWLRPERERLRETGVRTLRKLLALQTGESKLERAVETAMRLLAIDPLHEAAHRALMRLYDRLGRRTAALRQYELCADVLRRELGVAPEPDTRRLYDALMTAARTAVVPRAPSAGRSRRSAKRGDPLAVPLVGRTSELQHLGVTLKDVLGGRGRAILISGEAGIGKTRLLHALEAQGRESGFRLLLGRCYELTRTHALGPWAEALRAAGVAEDPDLPDRLDPNWFAELSRLLPELGKPGLQLPERAEDHLKLFESMGRLMEYLSSHQPTLVVLEDLHWADEMSVQLLFWLGRRLPTSRVLFVATLRDDELPEGHVLGSMLQTFQREWPTAHLSLAPLTRPDISALTRAIATGEVLGTELEQLEEGVWDLSQGNPFMAIEMIRALRESASGEATAPLGPRRVDELIQRRLAKLAESAQRIVAVAAVAGRDIGPDVLRLASGIGEGEVADALALLIGQRILVENGDRFDFVHDIVRMAASRRLMPLERRALHRSIAEALEVLRAPRLDAHLSTLATHYLEAGVWDKAVLYLRRAADQAADRAAGRDGVTFLEKALEVLHYLSESREKQTLYVDLVLELCVARLPIGLPEGSNLDGLHRARALAESLEDQGRLALVHARLARCLHATGQPAAAREYAARSIALGSAVGDATGPVLARIILAEINHFEGNDDEGIAIGRQNVEALSGHDTFRYFGQAGLPSVFARMYLVWGLARRGEFKEALAHAHEALNIAESDDRPLTLSGACHAAGGAYLVKGELDKAIPYLERGLDLNRTRIRFHRAGFASVLGHAYIHAGRLREAIPLLEESLEYSRVSGVTLEALRLAPVALGYSAAGRIDDARRCAERGLKLAREFRFQATEAHLLQICAVIELRREPADAVAASSFAAEALERSRALGARPLTGHCHLVLGRARQYAGHPGEAQRHFAAAARLFREMDMRHWLHAVEQAREGCPGG
jgi:DNA-binding SARP family transcriptional activator